MIRNLIVDGQVLECMIDTGCSVTMISKESAGNRQLIPHPLVLQTIDRGLLRVHNSVVLRDIKTLQHFSLGSVEAHVLDKLPSGVDVVLGLDLLLKCGFAVMMDGTDPRVVFHGEVLSRPYGRSPVYG